MIYHITTETEWLKAEEKGAYTTPTLESEGFIHCSTREQVPQVANAFYLDIPELVLLCIDEAILTSEIKWEPPAHPNDDTTSRPTDEALFPHVYGLINVDAVVTMVPLHYDAEGHYKLSDETP